MQWLCQNNPKFNLKPHLLRLMQLLPSTMVVCCALFYCFSQHSYLFTQYSTSHVMCYLSFAHAYVCVVRDVCLCLQSHFSCGVQMDTLYKLLASQLDRWMATGENQLRSSAQTALDAQTHGLCSNTEFQPRQSPIWPQFFVYNHCRYGHQWATMLRPHRTRVLRLDLCNGSLSRQLACARL